MHVPLESGARADGWTARRISWFAFGVALAVYLLSEATVPRSDALFLTERVAAGPRPYYNLLYVPLGWAFHRALLPLLGWDAYEALRAFSSLCAAASIPIVMRTLRRFGVGLRASLAWGMVLAFTPALWVFAVSVEVHTLQLLGAVLAIDLAVRARREPAAHAFRLVVLGIVVSTAAHITAILLAPLLLALATGDEPGRGFDARAWLRSRTTWLVSAALLALAGLGWWLGSLTEGGRWSNPIDAVLRFSSTFLERLAGGSFFQLDEMAVFLREEVLVPMGLLGPLFLIAFATTRTRRYWVRVLVASLPYFLLILQGGIRESGAYYLPLFATVVLYLADSLRPAPRGALRFAWTGLLLLAFSGQLLWSQLGLRAARSGEDARVWVRRVEAACQPRSIFLTDSLPKRQSAVAAGYTGFDLSFQFTLLPRAQWPKQINQWTSFVADQLLAGRRVYLDAELLDPARQPAFAPGLLAKIRSLPVRLVEVRGPEGKLLAHEVIPALGQNAARAE